MNTYFSDKELYAWLDSLSWYRRWLYTAALESFMRYMQKHLHRKEI